MEKLGGGHGLEGGLMNGVMKCFLILLMSFGLGVQAYSAEIFHSGPSLNISVERNGVSLPIYQVNHLKKGDKFSVQVDPVSMESTKWLMVIAQINPTGSKVDKKVFDLTVKNTEPQIEILDDEFLPVVILAPQLRNLFGLYTSVNESANLIVESLSTDPQKFVDLKNIDQLNQAIVAISNGLDNLLENQDSQKSVEIVKYLAQKFGLNEVDPNCFKGNYINTQCVATDIVANKNMIVPSSVDLGSVVGKGNVLNLTSLLTQNLHLFSAASDFLSNKFRDQYDFAPSFARHKLNSTSVELFSINRFQNGNVKTAYIYVPGWSEITSPKIQLVNDQPICISNSKVEVNLDGKSPPVDYWRDWDLKMTDKEGKTVNEKAVGFNFFRSTIQLKVKPDVYSSLVFPVKADFEYYYGFERYKIENLDFVSPIAKNKISISGLDTLVSNEKVQITFSGDEDLRCLESLKLKQGNIEIRLEKVLNNSRHFFADLKAFNAGSADLWVEQMNTDSIAIPVRIQAKRSKIRAVSHLELDQELVVNGDDLDRINDIQIGKSNCKPDVFQEESDSVTNLIFKCSDYILSNADLPSYVLVNYLNHDPGSEQFNLTKKQAKPRFKVVNSSNNPILVFLSKNAVSWGLKEDDPIISEDSGINLTFAAFGAYKIQPGSYAIEIKFEDDPVTAKNPIQFPLIGDKKTNELKTRKPIVFSSYDLPSIKNNVLFRIRHRESGLSGNWSELNKSIVQIPNVEKNICDAENRTILLKGKGLDLIEWSSETDNILNPKNKTSIARLIKPCEGAQCLSIMTKNEIKLLYFKLNWIDDRLFGFSMSNAIKECFGN
jgi:hypothetical protein